MHRVVVLCLCVLVSTANADAEEAARLFAEGRVLLADGRAADACVAFERAIRLDPTAPGTMLNLGLCNEVVGHLSTALSWFRRAQVRAAESGQIEVERIARERTMGLASKVPTVAIVPRDTTIETRVTLDGKMIDEADFGRVEVDAGEHLLEASAAGYRTVHERFTIADGDTRSIAISLEPVRTASAARSRPGAAARRSSSRSPAARCGP